MAETPEAVNPALASYYQSSRLMWRNLVLILLLNLGWAVSFTVVSPLIQLRLNAVGISESGIGLMYAINTWIYCYAVMYFAWKSDHTVSRFGRRIPYLFISAPVIIGVMILFPLIHIKWVLLLLAVLQSIFLDIKAATIPLLNIDCMPRRLLARTAAPSGMAIGLVSFLGMRYGMKLSELEEALPHFLAAGILTATTIVGGFFIKEPPVKDPTSEKFKPWSAIRVALKDRRKLALMASVSLFQTFQLAFNGWIWLYAKNVMHLSRMETGMAMSWGIVVSFLLSFPCAWLIDRVSPYKLLPCYCGIAGLAMWFALHINSASDIVFASGLAAVLGSLYGASDIMVYRDAHPAEIGSVTSTNSCLRGFYAGFLSLFLGFLINHTERGYDYVFMIGFAMTALGLVPLFLYRQMMRGGQPPAEPEESLSLSGAEG